MYQGFGAKLASGRRFRICAWCQTCKRKQIQNLRVSGVHLGVRDLGVRCPLRRGFNIGAKCVAGVPLHANIDCDCRDSSLFVHMAKMCHVT